MLFAYRIYPALVELFYLIAIGCFQGSERTDITGLGLMGSVRWYSTQYDVVFKAELQDLERLVRSKAIAD